jgi:1-acyl-sn-glycerol-3-phosphate acyltransferase
MRAKVHSFFETKNQSQEFKKTLKENVRALILNDLHNDLK